MVVDMGITQIKALYNGILGWLVWGMLRVRFVYLVILFDWDVLGGFIPILLLPYPPVIHKLYRCYFW